MPEISLRERARARHLLVKSEGKKERPHAIMFQNFYTEGQETKLDPAFVPHDGTRNARTDHREVALFLRLYHSGQYKAADYTGIVSPKFGERTRITGTAFLDFVARNPGYDVYFINSYPSNAYYSFNVWEHGEIHHPGLMTLAQYLFDCAGLGWDVFHMGRNSRATLLYCNYWLGNERFWDRFIDLNLRLLRAAESLPPRARARLLALDPDYPDPVPMLPFVLERLFSTLLLMEPAIRGCAFPHSRQYIMTSDINGPDEREIAASFLDVVDEIDRRGEYNERDRALFRAVQQLKRRLNGRVS